MSDSRVARVTLYEDRAEVVRRARVGVSAGTAWVEVGGIGVAVDDCSLVASAAGARVLAARVHRRVQETAAASAAELAAIEADLRAARGRRVAAERGLERSHAAERRLAALLGSWTAGVRGVPTGGAERWRQAHDSLLAALRTALDKSAARRAELELAKLDEGRATLRLEQGRALQPRYVAVAQLQLEAAVDGLAEVELVYRTPCASWRPEHIARLDKEEIVLRTAATVWQRTGEEWRDVACRFSTARPARAAAPPLLEDDVLRLRKKAERTVSVEARDMAIAATGAERGVRKVEDMPGVDDGGEPQWFEAPQPVTIPADGQPVRVEVAEVRMPCSVDRVCYPELGGATHVRATATLPGPRPLLAGPVRVARGASIVGRGRIGFVGPGEAFELGFGVDDGLRVRRRMDERHDASPVLGSVRITRTVHVYVSNLGDAARRLMVVERVPVSEIDDVQVKVTDAGSAAVDARDGFVRFSVEVAAGGTHELRLGYRIDAPARVQLSL